MSPSPENDPIEAAVVNWVQHGWEDAATPMSMVTSVMRVQQLLAAETIGSEAVRREFCSYDSFACLRLVAGARCQRAAGERLQVHPASVTNAADRLERDGLVSRSRDDVDRRRSSLQSMRVANERRSNERIKRLLSVDSDVAGATG